MKAMGTTSYSSPSSSALCLNHKGEGSWRHLHDGRRVQDGEEGHHGNRPGTMHIPVVDGGQLVPVLLYQPGGVEAVGEVSIPALQRGGRNVLLLEVTLARPTHCTRVPPDITPTARRASPPSRLPNAGRLGFKFDDER